ncbi:MAG: phytoene/squalene synthase family protein [Rhodovibrionaceae bacterium]
MTASRDLSFCGTELRRHDRDRFMTCLFAPPERREALFALYAFNQEVAKTPERVSEPMIGQMRLQWWREAIEGIYSGSPRKHQVVEPLAEAVESHGLSRKYFDRLIDTREKDLEMAPPENLPALEDYADGTAATLTWLALEILGVKTGPAMDAGRRVGVCYAMTGLLRAIPFHASQKRVYIPSDLLAASSARLSDIFALKPVKGLPPVVEQLAAQAREHLMLARALRLDVPKAALPALLPLTLAERYLKLLAKAGYDPFDPRVQRPLANPAIHLGLNAARGRF